MYLSPTPQAPTNESGVINTDFSSLNF